MNSFDLKANADIEPPARALTLTLKQPAASVRTDLPAFSGTTQQSAVSHPKSVSLLVPDHILVVEITPARRNR